MGFPDYRIIKGKIIFKGRLINDLSIDERARLGIGVLFQRPPTVRGVRLRRIVEFASKGKPTEDLVKRLNLEEFLDREINLGFSGGEIKRSELLQLISQSPDLSLLDEPESGVDLENINLIGDIINKFLNENKRSALIITHTGYILDYVNVDRGCVLVERKLHCLGDPKAILNKIRKSGYQECVECERRTPEKNRI
jgi:Fe-S cluster assembly ATP-binding protein